MENRLTTKSIGASPILSAALSKQEELGTARWKTDLFGKEIMEANLTTSDPIKAGEKATWSGTLKFNQFRDAHVSFRNAELKDMKVEWRPMTVIFVDGTEIGEATR